MTNVPVSPFPNKNQEPLCGAPHTSSLSSHLQLGLRYSLASFYNNEAEVWNGKRFNFQAADCADYFMSVAPCAISFATTLSL